MFKRFVNFVAVILLFMGFDAHGALEKIRDSEYMRTAYQFDTEKETKVMVLTHTYAGDTEEIDFENPHDGFED